MTIFDDDAPPPAIPAESEALLPDFDFVDDGATPPADLPPIADVEPGTTAPDDGLKCVVCGATLTWAGRGRKPMYCAEHNGNKGKSRATVTRVNTNDAAIAAKVLSQGNNMVALALQLRTPFSLPKTGERITELSDAFETEARRALESSPALARTIARAGGMSGTAGLLMAYGMLIAGIAPIAIEEWKTKKRDTGKGKRRETRPESA